MGPKWSVRVSLANLDEDDARIGEYMNRVAQEYVDASQPGPLTGIGPALNLRRDGDTMRRGLTLVTCLACLVLLAPEPSRADHNPDHHPETLPHLTPPPPPLPAPTGLLERAIPRLAEGLGELPPFLRDTDLNLHFRPFYFDEQKADGTASEAWAIGGSLQYQSGWLLDTFAIGAVGYTSQPLYAPEDKDGTRLLAPGQEGITVLGESWVALRYRDHALLRGYRQRVDDGYVNSQDNRMLANTFEGVTLSGQVRWLQYDLGYLWDIKPRDSADFVSMSRQAKAPGDDEGLLLTSLTLTPVQGLPLYFGNYFVPNVFNTAFAMMEYTHPLGPHLALDVGLQYTDQRSTGDARIGSFSTWNVGAGARLRWNGLSVGAAMHSTADGASLRTPYGSWPGYLSLMVTDFDRADEKAFGVGVNYDFGGTLLPVRIPGLSVSLTFGQGTDRRDAATGAGLPTTREGDLDIIYSVPAVRGLSFRFRNAYVDQGGPELVKDFRLIVNYDLNLL